MIAASLLLEQEKPKPFAPWSKDGCPDCLSWTQCLRVSDKSPGTPENYLAERDEAGLVFLKGRKGSARRSIKAYQLQDFGQQLQGFAADQYQLCRLASWGTKGNISHVELGALGSMFSAIFCRSHRRSCASGGHPLSKYRIRFGEPIYFQGDPDEDEALVEQRVRQKVKDAIAELLDDGLNDRKGFSFDNATQ